jgi:alpha-glucuronidase
MKMFLLVFVLLFTFNYTFADDGYRLWLKYDKITDSQKLQDYQSAIKGIMVLSNSPTGNVIQNELRVGLSGLLSNDIPIVDKVQDDCIFAGIINDIQSHVNIDFDEEIKIIGSEGYVILNYKVSDKDIIIITANTEIGVLYGTFHFLRLVQTLQEIDILNIVESPKIQLRVLDHWDNLDRTIERGYAGFSLWDWHKLPDYIHPYYHDYARATASIGINGAALNNVNANALMLTPLYLNKVAALADVFRPYGIKVYLSVRFSAPIDIGGLEVSDPLDVNVKQRWKDKTKEIYEMIPDFGGFLVKANSEGQPGPQKYGRSHADGANMLADALKPFGGVVMWRAFVYDPDNKEDRAKQAYQEFKPLDGTFRDNVLIQVKNGPIDFQPREPFHPIFGGLPKTTLMMEFQITQEYLGFSTNLVYLATLYKEVLDSDTYAKGEGSTVARVIDGSVDKHSLSGIAGVANTGTDRNWTGHIFAQSNWYCYGRLAWDHQLSAEEIADEWIRMTLSNDPLVVQNAKSIMMNSRENTVNYMTPLGLHHLMGWNHHYGPAPWIKDKHRDDWTSVYYHKADSNGIGFDRTKTGSNAVSQYHKPVAKKFASLESCPEEYLLWFHHLSWDYQMKSGKTLWEELCYHYYQGAESVVKMQDEWATLKDKIDPEIFEHVTIMMKIQRKEALWWRDACVLYFQTFSKRPIPPDLERPDKTLEYYQNLSFPYAPK